VSGHEVVAVGVTGHRALADTAGVELQVDELLDQLLHERALELWSSLAEGADRVAARRALSRRGARLVVVLPLEAEDYARDFATTDSKDEFAGFLARADRVEITGPGPSGTRESAYERAGRAVVDGSDMLLAIWDGSEARGRGGTAQIVAYARERGVPVEVVTVERSGTT
jgi:hypothetical protein